MRYRSITLTLTLLAVGIASPVWAQPGEVKLDTPQTKITTVSAMRARRAPQVSAPELSRLKLGTVVNVVARSTDQDTVGNKTDYWYRITLPNGESGWVFGGLLLDYSARERNQLLRQIIEARMTAENTDFGDRREIYELAAGAMRDAKDTNTRAEFELLRLQALAVWGASVGEDLIHKSPYREWYRVHKASLITNEFAGIYNVDTELFWKLEAKYHALPVADRIAWAAAQNPQPSDCEGDEVCYMFVVAGEIKYLNLHPNGAHAAEALKNLNELLTEEVINVANGKGGDVYDVEQRNHLRKLLATLRAALGKTSAAGKSEIVKKLERVKP